jgi:hypothetical protein
MILAKRNSDLNIEKISNGFILSFSGRDSDGDYISEKLFTNELTEANNIISDYFDLPEDN